MRFGAWAGLALVVAAGCSKNEGPPAVASVAVSPGIATTEVGTTTQLSATPRDANGNALTNPVEWRSGTAAVASVSGTGLVTGVSVGTATITATSGGQSGTAVVTVTPPSVNSVAVTLAAGTLEEGRTTQATAVLRDVSNNVLTGREIAWTSANPNVATVSQGGLVTAVVAGTTTISASSEGKTGNASLTVIVRPVTTVSVTLSPASILVGQTSQATRIARDADGNALNGRAVTWSSANQQIATVNASSGVVTAVAAGQTNITATVEGITGSAQLTVTAVQAFGTVTGTVMANDGVTPIPDALVEVQGTQFMAARGARAAISTRSALDGSYTLANVPSGPQVIVASRGAFRATVNVTVQANQSTTAPVAKMTSTGKLAYVDGSFDNIEGIVQGVLGNPIDALQAADLASSAITSQYRMIFLNCGLDATHAIDPAVVANLKAFLQAGGTIYASDWAIDYIEPLVTGLSHDKIGDEQSITGTIADASLQAFVGKTNVSIVYDLGGWTDLLTVPSAASVLVRGTYVSGAVPRTNQPLAIVIPHGAGKIVFTTFHNEAGATADQIAVLRHFIYIP
jgi:uncharacterized protein YjdB